jgi:hypothetical protein
MSAYRAVKHFVVTWENGRILISQAREIVPRQTYQIIQQPKPYMECAWNMNSEITFPHYKSTKGIGLGETAKIKSSLT